MYSLVTKMKKNGSGDIIRKKRQAGLSFLYPTICIDLFYNPTKYHTNISNGCGVTAAQPPADVHHFNNLNFRLENRVNDVLSLLHVWLETGYICPRYASNSVCLTSDSLRTLLAFVPQSLDTQSLERDTP